MKLFKMHCLIFCRLYMSEEKKLLEAINTLKKYCEHQEPCEKCIFYGDEGCEIFAPIHWKADRIVSEMVEELDEIYK